MIVGIGVDSVSIPRIAKALENPRFTERIYTLCEREVLKEKGAYAAEYAAGRWAAKEAVAKALGGGLSLCPPDSVEILNDETGRPVVQLYGAAKARLNAMGGERVHISLTHDAGIATAFAVLEGGKG